MSEKPTMLQIGSMSNAGMCGMCGLQHRKRVCSAAHHTCALVWTLPERSLALQNDCSSLLLQKKKLQQQGNMYCYRSGLPNDCGIVGWNLGSFVFFKLTSVPSFGPACCFSNTPLFLRNYARS